MYLPLGVPIVEIQNHLLFHNYSPLPVILSVFFFFQILLVDVKKTIDNETSSYSTMQRVVVPSSATTVAASGSVHLQSYNMIWYYPIPASITHCTNVKC